MEITPSDSRYIPIPQQQSCCVPACLSMILYKREITLIAQEEIGWHLGLVVREEHRHLFWNARIDDRPPSGFGTQTYKKEFSINEVFKKLEIPLEMNYHSIDNFEDEQLLEEFIQAKIEQDVDLLVCFDHGELRGDHIQGGHVCVVDKILEGNQIRLIDPAYNQPKWRIVEISALFDAMQKHGAEKMAGIWEFKKL